MCHGQMLGSENVIVHHIVNGFVYTDSPGLKLYFQNLFSLGKKNKA